MLPGRLRFRLAIAPGRSPSWKARLLAAAVSLAAALLAAELGLRIAAIDMAAPWIPDEHCGWRLRPNHCFRQYAEGSALVVINRAGHRDREHAIAKPPGVIRIAVLGDSYAEALQVDLRDTFWSVMERELAACPALAGHKVEVLNFGVAGYGTTQELQMLRHYVWPYQPDIVLVAFLPANDVRNNSRQLETENPSRPFYELVHGQLQLDLSFREVLRRQSAWLKFKSALVRHVRLLGLVYRVKENFEQRSRESAAGSAKPPVAPGLDNIVFAPSTDARWADAWTITGAVLGELAREAAGHQARLIVVAANTAIQIDVHSAVAADLRRQFHLDDLDEPDRRLVEIGRQHGFPVLLLTPRMRAQFERDGRHFHGFPNTALGQGHWNAYGHRVAGELLARDLCQMKELWVTKGTLDFARPVVPDRGAGGQVAAASGRSRD